jgi:hypothetical protein
MQADIPEDVAAVLAGMSGIPPQLICEQCGERPVDVVVTHMNTKDNDRQCYPCFLVTVVKIAQETIGDDSAE